MCFMAPKKRKSHRISLEEEKKPEFSIEFPEELAAKIKEAKKELEKTEHKKEDKSSRREKIKRNIDKIKAKDGIVGYIFRNAKSASIDLNDPAKVIDYAVLSSSALEASNQLSKTFELGDVKYVLVEGGNIKLLSITVDESEISFFMENNINHNRIYKDLLS